MGPRCGLTQRHDTTPDGGGAELQPEIDPAEHAGAGCDQHVDSFVNGQLQPGCGVYGDHHRADGIADSEQCKLDSVFDVESVGDQWGVDAVDGAAGVDSGIRGHGVGDSMCGDVYFVEYGHGAIVAGGECVGRD
jgi:hypothetical protein